MTYRPHMLPKVRSKAIRSAANGAPCTIRVSSFYPGHRCSDGTTVFCHFNSAGKGVSTKSSDMAGAFGCSNCHDIIDGRDKGKLDYITSSYPSAFADRVVRSMIETHAILIQDGVIVIPDGEMV